MKLKVFGSILFLVIIAISCSEDKPGINPNEPSDLTVEIEIPDETPGYIEVIATATNAVSYEFDLGDGSELISDDIGVISYTYEASGSYSIEIKAYGISGRFLRETKNVEIILEDGVVSDEGYKTPLTYSGYTLVWNDEFEGTSLDESAWNFEIGTGANGWGNNELQYYKKENTLVDQGYLIIEAKRESFNGSQYTSSRITTENKTEFNFGRIDIRAKLPKGQGIWPALWMLGANFRTVGWPSCGEIDIMELVGGGEGKDNVVHGTVHWDNNGSKADFGGSTQLSSGIFNDEFHVFTIIWDSSTITWYMDDQQYHAIDITQSELSEFQEEFFFIFNVAVGGNWPGSPNANTIFPQQMIVDYVRVFQEN